MRRPFDDQGQLFSYISPEQRVPAQHPLRTIRELVRKVFRDLDRDFRILYSTTGRPLIPPEQLLSALLLQMFCGVRSERQLMEQLDYNLLYRWFVGLSPDDAAWDATTFTKNRERLQQGDMFNRFKETLLHHQAVTPLLADEHFSVDGTLIEAWAGHKSFKPKTGQARKTSIDGRTTRHKAYSLSQGKRKMIECMFGWGKQHGAMRKTKYRGLAGVAAGFRLNLIGYNLIRIPKLLAQRG